MKILIFFDIFPQAISLFQLFKGCIRDIKCTSILVQNVTPNRTLKIKLLKNKLTKF